MADDNLIVARNVTRRFKRGRKEIVLAVNDSDIEVPKGKVTLIMGASGSGKSTMLNLLSGLDKPDEGKIIFDEQNIVDWDIEQLSAWRRSTVGFVFQQFELIPHLTALENVLIPLLPSKEKTSDIRMEAMSLLKQVGIFDTQHERAIKLSGGEQQRVAIARAMANDPPIILADEPTANLDGDSGQMIRDLLIELNKMGKAVIVMTHDQGIIKLPGVRHFKMIAGELRLSD